MSASSPPGLAKREPLELKPKDTNDIEYFTEAWWSGTRGGGTVPADFDWPSNPKETQEETGSGLPIE